MHVCMCVCVCVLYNVYDTHVCVSACVRVCVYTHGHVCDCVCMCVYMSTYLKALLLQKLKLLGVIPTPADRQRKFHVVNHMQTNLQKTMENSLSLIMPQQNKEWRLQDFLNCFVLSTMPW